MRTTLRMIVVGAVAVFMLALAGAAMADHDHKLTNPGGCHTIPVEHQEHGATDPGNKFHGAAHKGAATVEVSPGLWVLGKGNSRVSVNGGEC